MTTALDYEASALPASSMSADAILRSVREISNGKLAKMVGEIDRDGLYPEDVLRSLGAAGAYRSHCGDAGIGDGLKTSIQAMQIAGEHCLSTSFCMWCQDAMAWYAANSANAALKDKLGAKIALGATLGGTGLSNPMKSLFGIETMRLKGRRVNGGYSVKGVLPWVSNLGPDHVFGTIFEMEDDPRHHVMIAVDCAGGGVKLTAQDHFVALEGTRTFAVQIRDAFIPDSMVLADPCADYVKRIRAGFILLQTGMAFGIIQSSIDLMKRMRGPLGHVNKYLEEQPEYFEVRLAAMQDETYALCDTPFLTDIEHWRRVIQVRLTAGEMTVKAAHAAMLHCGARGYLSTGEAQRRLREAYFVAIVTPATKQLRKMLADLQN
ncbi:MAG: acyl-CoA/acyl-ACP dehydrogenase [Chitinophagales bacterium]|nr:acyl-CoA/acyl-ACP dehydrogenase [Hyphomicrobiales bacterium]